MSHSFRILQSDTDIESAYGLAAVLRPHLQRESFLPQVRKQYADGYRLCGLFTPELVCLAGFRTSCTLSRGPHLFVDDLVTCPAQQGQGHGSAMLRWLARYAREQNLPAIYLDSRDTAQQFYRRIGFEFLTAIPCRIPVDHLLNTPT